MQCVKQYQECKAKNKLDVAIEAYIRKSPASKMGLCLNELLQGSAQGRSQGPSQGKSRVLSQNSSQDQFLPFLGEILQAIPDGLAEVAERYQDEFFAGVEVLRNYAPKSDASNKASGKANSVDLAELMKSLSLKSENEDLVKLVLRVLWSHECQEFAETVQRQF